MRVSTGLSISSAQVIPPLCQLSPALWYCRSALSALLYARFAPRGLVNKG